MFTSSLGEEAAVRVKDCPDSTLPCRPARRHKEIPLDPGARAPAVLLAPVLRRALGVGPSASEIHPRVHRAVYSPAEHPAIADASAHFLSLEDLSSSDRPRSTKISTFEEIRPRPRF